MIRRRSRTPDAGTLHSVLQKSDVFGPGLASKLFAMFQTMLVSLPVKIGFSISTRKIYTRSNKREESLLLWCLTLCIHHCLQWSSHIQLRKEEKHFSQVSQLHNKLQLWARKFEVSEHFLQVQHSLQKKKNSSFLQWQMVEHVKDWIITSELFIGLKQRSKTYAKHCDALTNVISLLRNTGYNNRVGYWTWSYVRNYNNSWQNVCFFVQKASNICGNLLSLMFNTCTECSIECRCCSTFPLAISASQMSERLFYCPDQISFNLSARWILITRPHAGLGCVS